MGEFVVSDGRLITGMNPASAKKLANEMITMLDAAMKTGGTINYNKITGKNENLAATNENINLSALNMNKATMGQSSLPAEFHRSPQPYEYDHPKDV